MSRVFTDANVLFSAAISPRSVPRAIFELAYQHRGIELVMSGYAISEALSNLQDKSPEAALELLNGIGFATSCRIRKMCRTPRRSGVGRGRSARHG